MEIDSFRCQNGFQVHIFSVRDFVGKVKDFIFIFSTSDESSVEYSKRIESYYMLTYSDEN